MRTIVAGVVLFGCLGCVPQRELSSYSEERGGEQRTGLDRAVDEPSGDSAASSGDPEAAASAAVDTAIDSPIDEAGVDESSPEGVALDPASGGAIAADPASVSDSGAAPPSGGDAVRDAAPPCAALGGFALAESGSCYMLGGSLFSWQDARSFCQAWGGDLAEIGSSEENLALAGRVQGAAWIGANDRDEEGTFRWAGGEPLSYAAWAVDQPNNLFGNEDCSELRAPDGGWVDVPCAGGAPIQALCEAP